MQIARLCSDQDRRSLFLAWSRLCLHAASRNAAEATSATVAAAARAAGAEPGKNEAVSAAATANMSTNAAVLRNRAEVAEQGMRKEREKRAIQMVSRSVGWLSVICLTFAFSKNTRCTHAWHVFSLQVDTGACSRQTCFSRSHNAKHRPCVANSVHVDYSRRAVDRIVRHGRYSDRTFKRYVPGCTTRLSWYRLTSIYHQLPPESGRPACPSSPPYNSNRYQLQTFSRYAPPRPPLQIRRVYEQGDTRLLFWGWSRLVLHAASPNAIEGASVAAPAYRAKVVPSDVEAVGEATSHVELETSRARKLLNDTERLRAKRLVC